MDSTTNRKDKGCKIMGKIMDGILTELKNDKKYFIEKLESLEAETIKKKNKLIEINNIIEILEMSY